MDFIVGLLLLCYWLVGEERRVPRHMLYEIACSLWTECGQACHLRARRRDSGKQTDRRCHCPVLGRSLQENPNPCGHLPSTSSSDHTARPSRMNMADWHPGSNWECRPEYWTGQGSMWTMVTYPQDPTAWCTRTSQRYCSGGHRCNHHSLKKIGLQLCCQPVAVHRRSSHRDPIVQEEGVHHCGASHIKGLEAENAGVEDCQVTKAQLLRQER